MALSWKKTEKGKPYPPLKKVVKAKSTHYLKKLIAANEARDWEVRGEIQPFGVGVAVLMVLNKKGAKRQ